MDYENALLQWAKENPFLTDRLLYDFLVGQGGSCSISQIEHKPIKTYINGDKIMTYTFAYSVLLMLSENADMTNTDNMYTLRKWQQWIEDQEAIKNYPDFGPKCKNYRLECTDAPRLALLYENKTAKYQFFAKLTYEEVI